VIRSAHAEDVAAVAALEAEAFGDEAWTRAQILAQQADPGSVLLLADGDPPAGYTLLRVAADEAELLRIAVRAASRRSGVGATLLYAGLAWARARGADRVFLEVAADNGAALALYGRLGFERVGARLSYYGTGREAWILSRAL